MMEISEHSAMRSMCYMDKRVLLSDDVRIGLGRKECEKLCLVFLFVRQGNLTWHRKVVMEGRTSEVIGLVSELASYIL